MKTTHQTAILIDMDGVLYQGEQAIPGAAETLGWLQAQQILHLFVTAIGRQRTGCGSIPRPS